MGLDSETVVKWLTRRCEGGNYNSSINRRMLIEKEIIRVRNAHRIRYGHLTKYANNKLTDLG